MIDEYIKKHKTFSVTYISAFIWLILSHGMAIFNKYSFHDDISCFNSLGSTYDIGRWMLGIAHEKIVQLLGEKHYSIPLIDGVITALCIATIIFIFVDTFNITSNILVILTTGILISFPAITATFGYIFTAPYYYAGALMGVVGAYIFYKKRTIPSAVICSILMACSAGLYQANIPISICSLLLLLLQDTYINEYSMKKYFQLILSNIIICLLFITEYLAINKFYLWKFNTSLVSYKGINNLGKTSIVGYLKRIVTAYKEFVLPTNHYSGNMYPYNAKFFYILLILTTIILIITILKDFEIIKKLQLLSIIIVFPLASYFIFVMAEFDDIYSLMVYGEAFMFLLILWLLDKISFYKFKYIPCLRNIALILLGTLLFFNIRLSNICYLKAEIMQSQAISYYTTLIASIKNTDGYTDSTPVFYINEFSKNDNDFIGIGELFDDIDLLPYYGNSIINDYSWQQTMAFWCGYLPPVADSSVILQYNDDIALMPCYPIKGSIKNIDGNIIVKFAETEELNSEN